MRGRRPQRLNQKTNLNKPRLILIGTFVVWLVITIDAVANNTQILTTILISIAIWTAGLIGYKTTLKPGAFTERARQVGFFRALCSAGSNTSKVNTRRRRNVRSRFKRR